MPIGDEIRFYPMRKNTGGLKFVPFDHTELDLGFVGNKEEYKELLEYWEMIDKPYYDEAKDYGDNLQSIYNNLKYWPRPMKHPSVVQILILEYENGNN